MRERVGLISVVVAVLACSGCVSQPTEHLIRADPSQDRRSLALLDAEISSGMYVVRDSEESALYRTTADEFLIHVTLKRERSIINLPVFYSMAAGRRESRAMIAEGRISEERIREVGLELDSAPILEAFRRMLEHDDACEIEYRLKRAVIDEIADGDTSIGVESILMTRDPFGRRSGLALCIALREESSPGSDDGAMFYIVDAESNHLASIGLRGSIFDRIQRQGGDPEFLVVLVWIAYDSAMDLESERG